MGKNGPRFLHRIELTTGFPVGRYDPRQPLSPSSNIFYFNPYGSGTFLPGPEWDLSLRLQYVWNGKNSEPNELLLFPGVDSGQAG